MILPPSAREALALWTIFTYALDQTNTAPLLALVSPEKRCGKSTVLDLLTPLCYRALPTSNITPAALFRVVEEHTPCLLIDEADSFLGKQEEMRGILNSGHTRATAHVIRTVGDDYTPRQFKTWGVKAIATIGKLPDTLMDRAIVIPMRRKRKAEAIQRVRNIPPQVWVDLRRKIMRWVRDHAAEIRDAEIDFPAALHDRERDNWEPLFKIAAVAGGEWPGRAREAALALSEPDAENERAGIELLRDIREIIEGLRQTTDRITSAELVQALCVDKTQRWATYSRGNPLDARKLARLLEPYKIKPRQLRTEGGNTRGYLFEAFEDPFSRYLPPLVPLHRYNSSGTRDSEEFASATPPLFVADSKTPKALQYNDCSGVADKNRLSPGEGYSSDPSAPQGEAPADYDAWAEEAQEERTAIMECEAEQEAVYSGVQTVYGFAGPRSDRHTRRRYTGMKYPTLGRPPPPPQHA